MFSELWIPWIIAMKPVPAPGTFGCARPLVPWQKTQAPMPWGFVESCGTATPPGSPRQTWRPWQAMQAASLTTLKLGVPPMEATAVAYWPAALARVTMNFMPAGGVAGNGFGTSGVVGLIAAG